jgi:DNA invertase Pin-like site-specific DNA recombinase
MTNFVLYNRVATAGQPEPGMAREAQLARCLAYIESRGWMTVAEYVDDAQGDAA